MNLSELSTKYKVARRRLSAYGFVLKIGLAVLAVLAGGFLIVKIFLPFSALVKSYLFKPLSTFSILRDPKSALKSSDGRTNILILGRGGASHEAPDLTDTIIVASIRLKDRKISMISIPRDIWIASMKAKINSAYYYGKQKQPNAGGFVLAKDAVFQVTDLPIHYAVLVDFEGFKQAIDLVGGVEVEVKRGFVDEKYPVESKKQETRNNEQKTENNEPPIYETVKFEAGWQHLDGNTALKFTRSRNSPDPEEGTDFARSRRQQQILLALGQKLKQKETVLNAEKIKELKQIFDDYTETDLGDDEFLALGRVGVGINLSSINHFSLETGTKEEPGLLINPPTSKYGQWVLEPRAGDWGQIHEYINSQLGQ